MRMSGVCLLPSSKWSRPHPGDRVPVPAMRDSVARCRRSHSRVGAAALRTRRPGRSSRASCERDAPGRTPMSAATQAGSAAPPTLVPLEVLQRVRAEFLEMPGLRLTRAQARRLWALDEAVCDAILTALVDARFLVHSGNVAFMRAE